MELPVSFAGAVRSAPPNVVVVIDSPRYSPVLGEREEFPRGHPEIDFYVAGEGERGFAKLLKEELVAADFRPQGCIAGEPR